MAKVSIVLPTYNRAGSIEAAVRSVLQQTYSDFELIVVDDASTDGTREVLARIQDPRLAVVRAPANGGGARARNLGLERAAAPLVAFQDSDDFWLPTKLERQMDMVAEAGEGHVGVFCSFIYLTPRRTAIMPQASELAPGDVAKMLLRGNLISTQTLLARRADLEAVGGFDPALRRFQDWELCIRLSQRGLFRHDPVPGVVVRATPGSISTQYEAGIEGRRHIIDLCRRIGIPPEVQAAQHFDVGSRLLAVGRTKEAAAAFRDSRRLGGGAKAIAGLALSGLPSRLIKRFGDMALARRDGLLRY